MLRNHKASVRRDIVGIALCTLVGVFALTKAPMSVADVSGEPISMNFERLPLAVLVSTVAKSSGFQPDKVAGLEQLGDTEVNVRMQAVPLRDALQLVLNCAGFTYRESGDELPASRIHFLAVIGMMLGVLFLALILMAGIGTLFLPECVQS